MLRAWALAVAVACTWSIRAQAQDAGSLTELEQRVAAFEAIAPIRLDPDARPYEVIHGVLDELAVRSEQAHELNDALERFVRSEAAEERARAWLAIARVRARVATLYRDAGALPVPHVGRRPGESLAAWGEYQAGVWTCRAYSAWVEAHGIASSEAASVRIAGADATTLAVRCANP